MRKILIALLTGFALALLGGSAPALATGSHSSGCAAYNLCQTFPHGSHNCTEIGHPVQVGKWDPWGLDRDHDGTGCETPGNTDVPPPVVHSSAPSHKPSATPSRSTKAAGAGTAQGPQLAKTGPSAPVIAGTAAVLIVLGGGALLLARRKRRVQFEA
jgi:LPXTG-motif cell wall-anchored protein